MNLPLLLTLVICFTAGPSPEDAVQAELKKLEGTWTVTALEFMGNKAPEEEVKKEKMSFVFQGDKFTIKKGEATETEATVKLDPAKSPKTLDLTATRGNNQGKTFLHIYELTGDTLKLGSVFGNDNQRRRPVDFQDKTTLMVITLKRQK